MRGRRIKEKREREEGERREKEREAMLPRRLLLVAAVALMCAGGHAEPDPALDWSRMSKLRDEDKCYDNNGRAQVSESG